MPLIAVSRLALLAALSMEGDGPVHAVLDAGRGEFYYGEYEGRRCVREALMTRRMWLRRLGAGVVVVCEGEGGGGFGGACVRDVVEEPRRGMLCRLRWSGLARGISTMRLRWMRTICGGRMRRSLRSLRPSVRREMSGAAFRVRVGEGERIWLRWWRWSGVLRRLRIGREAEYAAIVDADRGAGAVRRCLLVAEAEGRLVGFAVGKVMRFRSAWRAGERGGGGGGAAGGGGQGVV